MTDWVPDACTLPTAQRPLRVAEFDDLLAAARPERVAPDRLRWRLAADPAVAATAADLMTRETACCGFFTFTLTATEGALTLDVIVPDAHHDVLDVLASRP